MKIITGFLLSVKFVFVFSLLSFEVAAQQLSTEKKITTIIEKEFPDLLRLYKHLHTNPELSFKEEETARLLANELKKIGLEVTEGVGGYGIVGLLKNGAGPTVMIRTDMDALPIKEDTGLPYASQVTATDVDGNVVSVMHACGHDLHMATWVGVARVFHQLRSSWNGTLVFVGQPAEEKLTGARAMIADGLFTRFPRPDYGIALHVNPAVEAGKVGYKSGYALANTESMTITVNGKGGHGATPHTTIDPIVMAAKIVLGLQTIVSRELSPIESPSVISVGSIHGGTTGNIIPNEVEMKLTIRSFSDKTREAIIRKIERLCQGTALAAGLEEKDFPVIEFTTLRPPSHVRKILQNKSVEMASEDYNPSVYNDPVLTGEVVAAFRATLGAENVVELPPEMFGEDFSNYSWGAPTVPTLIYSLGTSAPFTDGKRHFYPTHSSKFSPMVDPSLKVGVLSMSAAIFRLLETSRAK